MRKFCLFVAVYAVILAGCHRAETEIIVVNEKINYDKENWEVNIDVPVFSSTDNDINESCKILNREVESFVSGLQDTLKADAEELFNKLEESTISRPDWKCSLFVTDSIFMAANNYISMRLTVYTFTGGAHGITDFYSFNYDVENRKMLSQDDIIKNDNPELVNRLLKSHFKNDEDCFNTDPTIELVTAINFSPDEVCFTYGQYKLGPYVCGAPEIALPADELKEMFLPTL